jgi:hypothetical protein
MVPNVGGSALVQITPVRKIADSHKLDSIERFTICLQWANRWEAGGRILCLLLKTIRY